MSIDEFREYVSETYPVEEENISWVDIPFGRKFRVNPVTDAFDPRGRRHMVFTKVGEFEGVSPDGEIVVFDPSNNYTLLGDHNLTLTHSAGENEYGPSKVLTSHQINSLNRELTIVKHSSVYWISWDDEGSGDSPIKLDFHQGSVKDGVNGISNEALIAVLIDRMETFQSGPHPSETNQAVLTKLREALAWLLMRQMER